ncbi:hypothetical protein [Novosphingopyxis sp. YJ-S2-01]|uniref:hypothetical protein n=1 Tax=Novosphingopyxis sp. YJ-S2-01 TaxID=2794021 RepID=UPI0018DD19EA|nr:hypothetical protein [Novosphingopyxis sp. YJ-S2-01]MBH9537527.1 hypothetical protein [Novosphingopyxis sp. YJ-S2-01]
MGNAYEGTSSFEYGGETYRMTLNNRILIDMEDVLGYSSLDAIEETKQAIAQGMNPKLKVMIAILYASLVRNHPGITEDFVIDMAMSGDPEVKKGISAAMKATDIPVGNAKAAAETPEPESKSGGAGKASTKPGAKRGSRTKSSS